MVKEVEVELKLAEKLSSDEEFRKYFFRIQTQNDIAEQIIALRDKREMRQIDLAEKSGMKQSAISRIEQADYASWNYHTLLRVVESLDGILKVTIEPVEDIIKKYKDNEDTEDELDEQLVTSKYSGTFVNGSKMASIIPFRFTKEGADPQINISDDDNEYDIFVNSGYAEGF
jgi:transcriptional regulator with XRE-family HTH domain